MNCADPWRCLRTWSHENDPRFPDSVLGEAEARALQQGVTLEELLVRYIEAGLRGPQQTDE